MAAAFANHLAPDILEARSAGTMPSERVNPVVAEAMREKGIDVSAERPKPLTEELVAWANRSITMGCAEDEACPVAFVPSEDWGLPDPAGQPLPVVRAIRDEVERHVRALAKEAKVSLQSTTRS
jgi:arsenate reductase